MEKKVYDVEAVIKVLLTEQDIDDIMTTALEGGVTYWCDRCVAVGKFLGKEYASEHISKGGSLRLHLIEPFDDKDTEWYELTPAMFLKGVQLWLENGGYAYGTAEEGRVDCGEIDGWAADSIIQYAIFGELIYC